MLSKTLFRLYYNLCQITPEIYQSLFTEFNKKPQMETFGKYLKPGNLLEVYNIVKHAHVNAGQKI